MRRFAAPRALNGGMRRSVTFALALAVLAWTPGSAGAAAPPVTAVGPLTVVRPIGGQAGAGSVALRAARNEFESFQIVVGGSGAVTGARVDVVGAGFAGPGGQSIPASAVTVYREDYVRIHTPSDGEGWQAFLPPAPARNDPAFRCNPAVGAHLDCRIPDRLIPERDPLYGEDRNAFPVDIPAGENRVAWVDVLVPAQQAAGTYSGAMRVSNGAGESTDVPVTIAVAPVAVPSTSTIRGAFDLNRNVLCQVHVCTDPRVIMADYARAALDNRITVASPGDPPADPQNPSFKTNILPLFKGTAATRLAGARLTDVYAFPWGPEQAGAWRKALAAHGEAADRVSFHCDESLWATCNQTYFGANGANASYGQALGDQAKLRLQVIGTTWDLAQGPGAPYDALEAAIDTLLPVVNYVHGKPEGFAQYAGDQRATYNPFLAADAAHRLFAYTSNASFGSDGVHEGGALEYTPHALWDGWPSYAIDQPASEQRATGWLLYSYDLSGEWYWDMVKRLGASWKDCQASQSLDCVYAAGGNGDGTLFYPGLAGAGTAAIPGVGGTKDIPLESIRLKRIRDGREDYELLRQASRAQALPIAQGLFANMYSTDRSEAAVQAARGQVLDLLAGNQAAECRGLAVTVAGTVGTAGDDVMLGTPGDDYLDGKAGNDTICGGAGFDTLRGGPGDDVLDGQEGGDGVEYGPAAGPVTVDLQTGQATGEGSDTLSSLLEVYGTPYDDTLIGSDTNGQNLEYLAGIGGNDTITGGGGTDLLQGGGGADTINSRDGIAETVDCGPDTDPTATVDPTDTAMNCESTDNGTTPGGGDFALSAWTDCPADFIDSGSWDERGNLYIACGPKILVYNAAGTRLPDIVTGLTSSDVAPSPDADNDGFADFLYLARGPGVPKRINRGANGAYTVDPGWKLAPYPHPDYGMVSPAGHFIETDGSGRVYLADGIWTEGGLLYESGAIRQGGVMTVVKYEPGGSFVTRFGTQGTSWDAGRFWGLSSLVVSRDGTRVFTLDELHNRVERWELQGAGPGYAVAGGWGATAQQTNQGGNCNSAAPAGALIAPAAWIGQFAAPYDIAMDAAGRIFVMNTTCHEVLEFTQSGEFVRGIRVSADNAPGPQATNRPHAFAVSRDGDRVYVSQAQTKATRGVAPTPTPTPTPTSSPAATPTSTPTNTPAPTLDRHAVERHHAARDRHRVRSTRRGDRDDGLACLLRVGARELRMRGRRRRICAVHLPRDLPRPGGRRPRLRRPGHRRCRQRGPDSRHARLGRARRSPVLVHVARRDTAAAQGPAPRAARRLPLQRAGADRAQGAGAARPGRQDGPRPTRPRSRLRRPRLGPRRQGTGAAAVRPASPPGARHRTQGQAGGARQGDRAGFERDETGRAHPRAGEVTSAP